MNRAGLIGLCSAASGVVIWLGTGALLRVDVPPPELPPEPPLEQAAVQEYRYSEGFYRALLDHDARLAGVAPLDVEALRAVHAHGSEFRGRHALKPGRGALETEHLRLSLSRVREWVRAEGQGYRAEHTILQIANRSDHHLAYVVQTQVVDPARCAAKAPLRHNAIALRPREAIERTECVGGLGEVQVLRVEVIRLTPLGHHYVSRLLPSQIGLDPRTADGHASPSGTVCGHVPAIAPGGVGAPPERWRDLIDFYARHNCDEYSFFVEYRAATEPLPALLPRRPPAPARR